MLIQRFVRPFVIMLVLALTLMPVHNVGAALSTEEWTDGTVVQNQLTRYYNYRTVSYAPYEIAFQQHSGPQVFMRWWDCNRLDPTASYVWDELVHGSWVWLAYNYPAGQTFCLDTVGGGSGYFDGWVSWDGY